MIRDYIKITEQDLKLAEDFFENEKHFNEWLLNVVRYYRGKDVEIKTKIVQKYFNNYKKTMDYILNSIGTGKKGAEVKAEKQAVKEDTLEGVVKPSLEPSLEPNIKTVIVKDKPIKKKEKPIPTLDEFLSYCKSIPDINYTPLEFSFKAKYEAWVSDGWKDGNGSEIVNWKTKIKNTIPFLKPMQQTAIITPKSQYKTAEQIIAESQ